MKLAKLLGIAAISTVATGAAIAASPQEKPCMASLPNPTPDQIARGKDWYVNGDKIEVLGKVFVKYGLPRVLYPGDVDYRAEYRGVAVGIEMGVFDPEVIYVLTDRACEFQPYQLDPDTAAE